MIYPSRSTFEALYLGINERKKSVGAEKVHLRSFFMRILKRLRMKTSGFLQFDLFFRSSSVFALCRTKYADAHEERSFLL